MKKLLILVIMALAVISVLAGCAVEARTYTDPGQTINLADGQEFVIVLESNQTTGYSWQEQYDNKILKLVDKSYKAREGSESVVGAGGTEFFRFQTLSTGETKITFTYKRAWEQPSPQDKTQTFTVDIRSG